MKMLLFVSLSVVLMFGCRTNETPRAQVDDLKITAELKSKLASDVGLSSVTDIAINSTNGVVTLSGEVASAEVRDKTVSIANSIPKVVRVIDNLQIVKPQARAPKPQIKEESRRSQRTKNV
jgi:hyperosmotically inducible protein